MLNQPLSTSPLSRHQRFLNGRAFHHRNLCCLGFFGITFVQVELHLNQLQKGFFLAKPRWIQKNTWVGAAHHPPPKVGKMASSRLVMNAHRLFKARPRKEKKPLTDSDAPRGTMIKIDISGLFRRGGGFGSCDKKGTAWMIILQNRKWGENQR